MGTDTGTKEAMMAGPHHIMLEVTDAAGGKALANAGTKVLILRFLHRWGQVNHSNIPHVVTQQHAARCHHYKGAYSHEHNNK